jgi:hypothetical protein
MHYWRLISDFTHTYNRKFPFLKYISPLYYSCASRIIHFISEDRALISLPRSGHAYRRIPLYRQNSRRYWIWRIMPTLMVPLHEFATDIAASHYGSRCIDIYHIIRAISLISFSADLTPYARMGTDYWQYRMDNATLHFNLYILDLPHALASYL